MPIPQDMQDAIENWVLGLTSHEAAVTEARARGRPFANCAYCAMLDAPDSAVCRRCISHRVDCDEGEFQRVMTHYRPKERH